MSKKKIKALQTLLDTPAKDIGSTFIFKCGKFNYLVLTEKESFEFAKEIISGMLFGLKSDILSFFSFLDEKTIRFIQKSFESLYANGQLYNTINLSKLTEVIIKTNGIESILSSDRKELNSGNYKIFKVEPSDIL